MQVLYSVLLGFKLTSLIMPKGWHRNVMAGFFFSVEDMAASERSKNNRKTNIVLFHYKCKVQCV